MQDTDKLFFITRRQHTHRQLVPKINQHVKQLCYHPWAAGSEVIMRARSICSLTPAVYLDYRNIDRPSLTGSRSQTLTAVWQTHRETGIDADKQEEQHSRSRNSFIHSVCLFIYLIPLYHLSFLMWHGVARHSRQVRLEAQTSILSSSKD